MDKIEENEEKIVLTDDILEEVQPEEEQLVNDELVSEKESRKPGQIAPRLGPDSVSLQRLKFGDITNKEIVKINDNTTVFISSKQDKEEVFKKYYKAIYGKDYKPPVDKGTSTRTSFELVDDTREEGNNNS